MNKFEFDDIYKTKIKKYKNGKVSDFVFDNNVVKVFPNMINRSIPGYELILKMTGEMSNKFIQNNTVCYDLGCSLLGTTLSIIENNSKNNSKELKRFEIIAVDNSYSMIETANEIYEQYKKENDNKNISVNLKFADINNIKIKNASFSVMNFVLQFLEPNKRFDLLKKIYAGTLDNGALLISDKVNFFDVNDNQKVENFHLEMHHFFKKLNGYSELEISQKRNALENVLITDSIQTHIDRLKKAGFLEVYQWFQCFNFVSFLAIK
ncbi:MAG: carboxy-S-adenosyl-L-methionine synthase CmoA [Elusimicrobiota bacterium]|jgi:tRNA (cmo5U34)-methyltransferase|nr:carboxy-S-adenosyl-L-methionine synthase CmoA [Elusimicrobiota bacterium]